MLISTELWRTLFHFWVVKNFMTSLWRSRRPIMLECLTPHMWTVPAFETTSSVRTLAVQSQLKTCWSKSDLCRADVVELCAVASCSVNKCIFPKTQRLLWGIVGVAGMLLHYKHKRVPFKSLFIRNARAHTKPGVGDNNSNNKNNKMSSR